MGIKAWFASYNNRSSHPIGLAVFRILFGVLMCYSCIRFYSNGWIESHFLAPKFLFKYYGFEWVKLLPENGLYLAFGVLMLSTIFIAFGYFYRISIIAFFLLFNYFELLDKTHYLNHYYLISIVAGWLMFLPANRYASLDVYFGRVSPTLIPTYIYRILQIQVAIVYVFAGFAKLSPDWLLEAMPLKIWFARYNPESIVGQIMHAPITAYIGAWFGFFYDISIPFLLWFTKTRKWAFLAVITFHLVTWIIFPIGVFPFVMIALSTIFFERKQFSWIKNLLPKAKKVQLKQTATPKPLFLRCACFLLLFQFLFPLRSHLVGGNVLWHEEGFNFSWRVMRVEKSGSAVFTVKDKVNNKSWEVLNENHLTKQQEKMMSFQPALIVQYAQYLAEFYQKEYHIKEPAVQADVFVSMNGKQVQQLIDPSVNLHRLSDNWGRKNWVLPYKN